MKLLVILLLLASGCGPTCYRTEIVGSVGGCNSSGRCGVTYESGNHGMQYFPSIGERYKIEAACGTIQEYNE